MAINAVATRCPPRYVTPMKTSRFVITWYALSAFAFALVIASLGCKTAGVYDPVKSSQVVAAIQVPVQSTLLRVLRKSPQHSDEIAAYIRAVGNVFCAASITGRFTPEQLIAEIEKVTQPLQSKVDPLVIDVKNAAVALYTIFYAQRHSAELSPEKWPAHVAKLLCSAIDTSLTDAGKPGVDWKQ